MTSSVLSKTIEQIKTIPQDLQWHVLEFVRVLTGSMSSEELVQPLAIKGTYQDGKIELSEAVNRRNGQNVIVTFLEKPEEESEEEAALIDAAWDKLDKILDDCRISADIGDLARQDDHYINQNLERGEL